MTRSTGGSIRHLSARNLWEGRYTAADGRRRSIYAPTRQAAQDRLREALTVAAAGIRPPDSRETVAGYLEAWLEAIAPRVRPRTLVSYRETVARYIVPAIGRVALGKLEPAHVARMLADLGSRPGPSGRRLSPTTVRYAYAVLRIALGRALKQGKVLRNVATLVDPPGKARTEPRPLTVGQVGALLASLRGDRLEALVVTAVGTGARQGELLALRWRDVDLDGGSLAIRHTLERRTRELAETKTARSKRTLRLPAEVLEALREHRRRQLEERLAAGAAWVDRDFVFTTPRGRPLDSRNVTQDLQDALRRADLPRQRFHDLRHAYATLMLEAGEELAVVSKSLGHANLSTTADVYAHLTPAMADRAAARMDGILGGARRHAG